MSPKVEAIVDQVMQGHRLNKHGIMHRGIGSRSMSVPARWEIWSRVRAEITIDGKPASWPWIGDQFGFHHTTVMHGVKKYRAIMAEETWRDAA